MGDFLRIVTHFNGGLLSQSYTFLLKMQECRGIFRWCAASLGASYGSMCNIYWLNKVNFDFFCEQNAYTIVIWLNG